MHLNGDTLAVKNFTETISKSRKILEGKILVVADEPAKSAKISPLQNLALYSNLSCNCIHMYIIGAYNHI